MSVSIFDKEDKEYCKPCSRYFDQNSFSWQRFACEFFPLTDNWIIAIGKELTYTLLKIKSKIDVLPYNYSIITGIIKELLCACYFNNIENLIESIISKEFHCDMQAYDYFQDLVTKTEGMFETLIDFDSNRKKLLEYS